MANEVTDRNDDDKHLSSVPTRREGRRQNGSAPGLDSDVVPESQGEVSGLHPGRVEERGQVYSAGDAGDQASIEGVFQAEYHSGPLPAPAVLQAYGEIDHSFPGRIMAMAERNQKAQISAELVPIKAQAFTFKFATVAVAGLPWFLVALAVLLLLNGKDAAGYITGLVGILGTGAQILSLARPDRKK